MKVKTPHDRMGGVGRFLVTLLVILIVVLVTFFFAVRTRGGHEFITERIEKILGVDLVVGRMRVGWPYALVLEDVRTEGFDEEGEMPGFAAQEVRLGPSLRAWYRIFIRRGQLRLVEGEGQMWAPACFARLGELPYGDLSNVGRMLSLEHGHLVLQISGGRVEWFDQRHAIMASAHGIDYRVTPVRMPGRKMQHHLLSLYSMTRPNGARLSDVKREWLSSGTIEHVELVDTHLEGTVTP